MITKSIYALVPAMLIAFMSIQSSAAQPSQQAQVSQARIYTVKEISEILKTQPNSLNGRTIQIKARWTNQTKGVGCDDHAILMDPEDSKVYQSMLDRRYSKEQRSVLRQRISSLPRLQTGPVLSMEESIFPTSYGIYEGHFGDPSLAHCQDGAKRFVIDRKIQEIVPSRPAAYQAATVSGATVIANGRYIKGPHQVVLQNHRITINGTLYKPESDEPPQITENTDDDLLLSWKSLVDTLKCGGLYVYQKRKAMASPTCPPRLIEDINAIVKSAKGGNELKKAEKAKAIDKLLDGFGFGATILENWRSP